MMIRIRLYQRWKVTNIASCDDERNVLLPNIAITLTIIANFVDENDDMALFGFEKLHLRRNFKFWQRSRRQMSVIKSERKIIPFGSAHVDEFRQPQEKPRVFKIRWKSTISLKTTMSKREHNIRSNSIKNAVWNRPGTEERSPQWRYWHEYWGIISMSTDAVGHFFYRLG